MMNKKRPTNFDSFVNCLNDDLQEYLKYLDSLPKLVETLSPFKVGDRVKLLTKVDFSKAPGWKGAEHFIVPGAIGTVVEVWIYDQIRFGIQFDNDSYIHHHTKKIIPSQDKGIYFFYLKDLEKIQDLRQQDETLYWADSIDYPT